MNRTTAPRLILVAIAGLSIASFSATAADDAKKPPADQEKRLTVAQARDRAELMHMVYAATLEAIHHHYFNDAKDTVPARAMEDVFAEISRETKIDARWIAVNAKAMSIHHKPKDDFEKSASAAIRAGKGHFERVEDGRYRRAGAIRLENSCLVCHQPSNLSPKTKRYAALVISMPVKKK
ncbi:MAG: DUF3365 domain-containing protein [Planctomycetes bacterium]|nr:DUF3365 domain-containing protein [Planctomycetota bacterium]